MLVANLGASAMGSVVFSPRYMARLASEPMGRRDYTLNHIVNRIPLVSARMSAYAALGVTFEDSRSGIIMLGAFVHEPLRLIIGRNSIIGPACIIDARGGITIGANVNIGGGSAIQTGSHVVDSEISRPSSSLSSSKIGPGSRRTRWCSRA